MALPDSCLQQQHPHPFLLLEGGARCAGLPAAAALPHALLMFDLDAGGSRGLRCMVFQMQTVLCITQEIEFLPTFVSKA